MSHAARLLFVLLTVLATAPLAAQPVEAPSIPGAETAFDNGLRQYQVGQFEQAARQFSAVANDFAYHQRTTAALLMAAKAQYAAGNLAMAASAATAFLREFPRSRYTDDARALRRAAQARLDALADLPVPIDLGVVLPHGGEDQPFTQALFNGIRIAVDEHNAARPEQPFRLVFRDTDGTELGAERAMRALARGEVEVAVGPLYSSEAIAAGAIAEQERITLVAPLATDDEVSAGRRYVLQANPTFQQRGRTMARYAAQNSDGPVGVVTEANTIGETMGRSFAVELVQQGGEVAFSEVLFNAADWFQLPAILGDTLETARAFYLPVSGAEAAENAAGALRGLDQITLLGGRPRVFGNTEWGDLEASRSRASRYEAAFTADFYLEADAPSVDAFSDRYSELAGAPPDRLAFAGYDVTRFILSSLAERRLETSVAETLREARPFSGLGHRIYFAGGSVNEAMFILGYRDSQMVVLD